MNLVDEKIENIIKSNRKIICFGYGAGFKKFIENFKKYSLEKKIEYIVDNNKEKIGKEVLINNKKIKIIDFETFRKEDNNNIYIVTNTYLRELIEQFNKYKKFKDSFCYYYSLLIYNDDKNYKAIKIPENLRLTEKPIIPKKIHYCWFGKGKKSKLNEKCIESWKKYCKDYEIIEWNEENYDVSKNKFMKTAYDNKSWAYVADYARLDIIEKYGGIYLDTDVEILQNIDELLYQKAFMGVDSSKRISFGLGFGAVFGLEEIKFMKKIYNEIEFEYGEINSKKLISPNISKKICEELGYNNSGEYQFIKNITVYPESILSALDSKTGLIRKNKNSYMAHHYEGTWTSSLEKTRRSENWKLIKEAVNRKKK